MKDKFTLEKINREKAYEKIRTQEFYSGDYAESWVDETPYKIAAQIIKRYLKSKSHLDVGTGLGYVVKYLNKFKIDAYGTEFSKDFIKRSPKEIKNKLIECDITNLKIKNQKFDSVSAMEVLEHLPPSLVDKAIEELKRVSKNFLFITIPSFGPDNVSGNYGLPINEKVWLRDAKKDVPFEYIVLKNGLPHAGHLTLATYRWWTKKFLEHELIRCPLIERAIYADKELKVKRFNWNIYVLSKINSDKIIIGSNDEYQLGRGWYHLEKWKEDFIRWTNGKATCYLNNKGTTLLIKFFSGPKELIYDFPLTITIYSLSGKRLFKKNFKIEPNLWKELKINIGKIKQKKLKIVISSESWEPKEIVKNADNRTLGIALKSIKLLKH